MKKVIHILLATLIILSAMTMYASATHTSATYEYDLGDTKYTVEFEDNNLTTEQQETIAAKILGIETSTAVPANIWCDLFGHDLVSSTVTATEHKVRSSTPRCLKHTYDVTVCEACDYSEQTLVASTYINCCPVD
ncbi:MAG: hypothetical protein IKM32_07170 [Clostridia bacterium]|nr:hypothetical protein [Clostridia bacterium]